VRVDFLKGMIASLDDHAGLSGVPRPSVISLGVSQCWQGKTAREIAEHRGGKALPL
jgi:hypothetical protein